MKYFYTTHASTTFDENGAMHRAWGIAVYKKGALSPERIIPDIFRARDAIEWFVDLINMLSLSPEQLDDAFSDLLCA